jgi:hypothetical protein
MKWILALILASAALPQPLRLRAYPQKIVDFYQFSDPAVPKPLSAQPPPAPLSAFTCQFISADGAVWTGTRHGLIRFHPAAPKPDDMQYFAGRRYLPDDEVLNLASGQAGGVWVRTRTGVSHIRLVPMTLEKKAAHFEDRIERRHDRYGLVASSNLTRPGDLSSNQLDPSDNDGLWTAMYAAAECFRYAVTRSPGALARARRSTEAVLFLEQVTGRPGFPARSYIRRGDWRPPGGVWHWTADGEIEWKADTSSDEIVGHFYLFGIAWDLLPDPDLRRRIAATAARIADHILDHGLNLTDIHGQPTYWGRWSPEYFQTPRGKPDAPLNAVELLSFFKTAHHITGETRFDAAYRKIAWELKYAEMTTRLLELRRVINYSDEELAMLPFYLLFQYEKDPKLLALYRRALDQWWENIRRENNPLWTFIYKTANPSAHLDLRPSVHTLYRIPIDLITWTVDNSHRADLEWESQPDRFRQPQSLTWLPPDERPVMKWNGNPFRPSGGNGGRSEDDGAFFLLPYWMGRHHKFIAEAGPRP